MHSDKQYIAIDLKSFYASVECVERGLDPLDTHLVVADASRTAKTICLAVSPSLKALGISSRARLFEVVQSIKSLNYARSNNGTCKFKQASIVDSTLRLHPEYAIDYIIAPPRMALYLDYSTKIYNIYLKYIAPEDIVIYSIDEVFIDATAYLKINKIKALDLASKILNEILRNTGITATAGIGTNLYLAKIAMDIVAKHAKADTNGLRLAFLDEYSYRKYLWDYQPITDFWRVGKGYAKRLASENIHTMGDIAKCSLGKENDYYNQALLYKLFGINAELLIDHAWGYETVTIADIKAIRHERKSLSEGQVLSYPYTYLQTKIILQEMAERLALDLTKKHLLSGKLVLTVGYDSDNLKKTQLKTKYKGEIITDNYGRKIPKSAHGTKAMNKANNSQHLIRSYALKLFDEIINKDLLIRRINLTAIMLTEATSLDKELKEPRQLDLFADFEDNNQKKQSSETDLKKERKLHEALLKLKHKYGNNAVFKASDLQEGATAIQRNFQIGGHKA